MSDNPSLTIRKLLQRHREENPETCISEKMLRAAVRSGSLPCVNAGNRSLISWQTFENWRAGTLSND